MGIITISSVQYKNGDATVTINGEEFVANIDNPFVKPLQGKQ